MNNWKYTIKIGEDMKSFQDGDCLLVDFAKNLNRKLKPILGDMIGRYPERSEELEDIILDLSILEGHIDDVDEMDEILERLYDFGDEDKILFVDSFR